MRMLLKVAKLAGVAGIAFCCSCSSKPPQAISADCSVEGVQALGVSAVTVKTAKPMPAEGQKQPFCEVIGEVLTDGEGAGPGKAGFKLLLPESWNQKLLFGGSRGTGGNLGNSANFPDIDAAMLKGYAIATTDMGHSGADEDWYAGTSPGEGDAAALADFHFRATHQVTVAAKALLAAHYDAEVSYAYFDGCSNGGRQAIMEAVRYPDDFDGVIAGCPWLDFAGSAMLNIQRTRAFLPHERHVPLSKFPQIDAAVLANCDTRDGVKDGMIQNPMNCEFDPKSLVPAVLTAQQANAIDLYLNAVRDDQGNMISPGSSIDRLLLQMNGVRNQRDGSPLRAVVYEDPAPFPTSAFPWGEGKNESHTYNSARGVVQDVGFNDPTFDITNGLYNQDGTANSEAVQRLYDRLAPGIVADPAKMKPFLERGGKLLIYHGLSDMTISGSGTVLYYRELARQYGGFDEVSDHALLFLVPGMQHCNDGPEPVYFNTLEALENWVERNQAPQTMQATYTKDAGKTPGRTMPLCQFPVQARYNGSGDVNDAANWSCPAGDTGMLNVARNGQQAGMNADLTKYFSRYAAFPAVDLDQ